MSTTAKKAPAKKAAAKKAAPAPVVVEKPVIIDGTWQDTINKSGILLDRSAKGKAKASDLLWSGAQEAINEWLPVTDEDPNAEEMQAEITSILGKSRKGDASKIKTVAVAVKTKGLRLEAFSNLSQAYTAANHLTKVVAQQADEDHAADEAIQALAESTPKSSGKPEGAILIALAGGIDEFARLVVDALSGEGPQADLSASRAALRALSQEIAGRVPKPEPKAKAPVKAKGAAQPAATPKDGAAKAKPAKKAAAPAPVEEPVEDDLGDEADGTVDSDIFDDFDLDTEPTEPVAAPEVPVKKAVARPKGRPVVKRG